MSKDLIQKIIRCFIVTLCFLGMLTVIGIKEREAQQIAFTLGSIVIFGLLLRNIWLTLFLGWTVFLYCFFKFEIGNIYVTNVFYGCLLYYLTKLSFKKEHINFFINAVLWFAVLNILYFALQINGYDFIYFERLQGRYQGQLIENFAPVGFMGAIAFMGSFMAICVPLLASRPSKWAIVGSLGLFVPIYLGHATMALWAAGIGLLFVLWFRISKKFWFTIVISLLTLCTFYFVKVDKPDYPRVKLWEKVLHDCVKHPITGWGLDSFRSTTSYKDFKYMVGSEIIPDGNSDRVKNYIRWWDNPHNLLVSLFFEFGIMGVFLLGGYLRQCGMWFQKAVKDSNTIGLAGCILVIFLVSQAHFVMFLARTAVIIIPVFALFEISTREDNG